MFTVEHSDEYVGQGDGSEFEFAVYFCRARSVRKVARRVRGRLFSRRRCCRFRGDHGAGVCGVEGGDRVADEGVGE